MMRRWMILLATAGLMAGCEQPSAKPVKNRNTMNDQTLVGSPAKLEAEGWEPVPQATYEATQSNGEVVLRAKGEAPSAGYEVKLYQSMLRIYPPQYMLFWKKPTDMAATVMTPFDVATRFKANEPVKQLIVTDGAGRHEVEVKR